jgi:hypothetical protein
MLITVLTGQFTGPYSVINKSRTELLRKWILLTRQWVNCSRSVTYWITNSVSRRILHHISQTLRFQNKLIWRLLLQVYLHSASEIPDVSSHFMDLEHLTQLTASIVSLAIYSTSDVRSLRISQRKCRFLEESDLDISPVYSYNLCRMQCRMDLAMRLCGCIPHFYRTKSK